MAYNNYPPSFFQPQQVQTPVINSVPSICVDYSASAESDAILLNKAYVGIGCDEQIVMNILTHRSSAQREQIKSCYNMRHKKTIIDRTISELQDPLEFLACCLLHTGPDADAYILKRATKGLGTHDENLIHILITRSSFQISKIKESYQRMYGKTLLSDVRGDTSGSYMKILTALIEVPRSEHQYDPALAKVQATQLYSRRILAISVGEEFIHIFTQSSYSQICLIGAEFTKMFGKTIPQYLENYLGNYEKTIVAIYLFATNSIAYMASYLRARILMGDIKGVICLVATRCEIDLATILNEYLRIYKSRAESDISNMLHEVPKIVKKSINMLFGLRY